MRLARALHTFSCKIAKHFDDSYLYKKQRSGRTLVLSIVVYSVDNNSHLVPWSWGWWNAQTGDPKKGSKNHHFEIAISQSKWTNQAFLRLHFDSTYSKCVENNFQWLLSDNFWMSYAKSKKRATIVGRREYISIDLSLVYL